MTAILRFRQHFFVLVYVVVAVAACVSMVRVLTKTSDLQDFDFHSYWYAGHFVWQAKDPYFNAFAQEEPSLPVRYWDGSVHRSGPIVHPDLGTTPALTAPGLLLISILSRFSWPIATRIWLALNLGMLIIIAWGSANYFGEHLFSARGMFLLFLLLSLISAREAIETGQSTLSMLGFMFLALILLERSQVRSGILLGIGLSKFTLTFPAILLLLYRRRIRAVAISGVVQIVGVILLAWIGHTTFLNIVASYIHILVMHAELPGMHLAQGLLKGHWTLQLLFGGTGLVTVGFVFRNMLRHDDGHGTRLETKVRAWTLLTALMMLNLLVLYHRRYDFTAGISFLALAVFTANTPLETLWLRSDTERMFFVMLVAGIAFVWIVPLYLVVGAQAYVYVYNTASIAAFCSAVWILHRLTQEPASSNIETG